MERKIGIWILALLSLVLLATSAGAEDIASSEASGELGVGIRSDGSFSEASGELGVGVENEDDQDEDRIGVDEDPAAMPNWIPTTWWLVLFILLITILVVLFSHKVHGIWRRR